MERMLVGVDGSPDGQDVLEWSVDLAGRAGLELVAARVFVPTQAELPPEEDDVLHDRQREELQGWCDAAADGTTGPRALLVDGSPPDGLLAAAVDERADLLAVGARGGGGFTHLHLGSVAHHLAHHTTLPLAIVPRTAATPVTHVVIGVDGSPTSDAAVAFGAALAADLGVGVTAVHAGEDGMERVAGRTEDEWRHEAEEDVRRWTAPITAAGTEVDVDLEHRMHPVEAIGHALDAHPGSVAVVGTRGLGGFTGLRLGRVPLQLVHHTGAAVILVPAAPDD